MRYHEKYKDIIVIIFLLHFSMSYTRLWSIVHGRILALVPQSEGWLALIREDQADSFEQTFLL